MQISISGIVEPRTSENPLLYKGNEYASKKRNKNVKVNVFRTLGDNQRLQMIQSVCIRKITECW